MAGGGAGRGPFALLTRHFFERLFHNDLVEFEDQMKERLIVALALLAVFFFWASELMLFKYHFVPDTGRSWQEKSYLLTLMMLAFGVITLLEWDVLFPDRRDFLNLAPLPVRLRTVFAAKLASFVLFAATFSAAMTGPSSVLFSIYLAQWRGDTLAMAGRYAAAHILAGFAACFAVLFAVVALQALLMAALPEGLYRRSALAVRFALIAGAVFLLLSFVAAPSVVAGLFRDLELLKETRHPFVFRFPPLWFAGLYEVLLGTRDAVFEAQARSAVLAVALSAASFLGASALSYGRHVSRILEIKKGSPAWTGIREAVRRVLARTVFRRPEERAVAGFLFGTLRSSSPHRMALVYYLAVAAALLTVLLAANGSALRSLTPTNGLFLVLPLLVAFAVLTGVRVVADRPASLEANWLFKLAETGRTARYVSGLKKAVGLAFLGPLFLAVFVIHVFIWDAPTAALHAAFGLIVSAVGLEALFYRYRKVPFACSWVPGRLKLQFTAVPVLIGLILTGTALSAWEKAVLAEPRRGPLFAAVMAAAWVALKRGGRRFYRTADLVFDEAPEGALVGFPDPD